MKIFKFSFDCPLLSGFILNCRELTGFIWNLKIRILKISTWIISIQWLAVEEKRIQCHS